MRKEEIDLIRSGSLEGFILYYNAIMRSNNMVFEPHLTPLAKALLDERIHNFLMIAPPGTGKSMLISVVWPTYRLGMNPSEMILGISGAEGLIQGFIQSAMRIIDIEPIFKEIFPKVVPEKESGWSSERGLFVKGHPPAESDASYWGCGIGSKALTGKHGTTIILDDIHDEENSKTLDQIKNVIRIFDMQIMGRTNPKGARMIVAGRRWHVDDIYGRLEKRGDFTVITLPAERPNQKILYTNLTNAKDQVNVFTEDGLTDKVPYGVDPKGQGFFWPSSNQKRRDYFILKHSSPTTAKSVYNCQPVSSLDQIFSKDHILYYEAPEGLHNGALHGPNRTLLGIFEHIVQSWDTASGTSTDNDWSVGLTAGLKPCNSWHRGESEDELGPCDNHYDIYILDEVRLKMEPARLIERIRSAHGKWKPDLPILIEKRSSGESILSILGDAGIGCEPMSSGNRSKLLRATLSVGNFSVQGWFQLGRIYLPHNTDWIQDFITELLSFDGSDGITDDRIDALIYMVLKVISLGSNVTHITNSNENYLEITSKNILSMNNEDGAFLPVNKIPEMDQYALFSSGYKTNIINPYDESCSTCNFYEKTKCLKFNKKMPPVYLCDLYERSEDGDSGYIIDCTTR